MKPIKRKEMAKKKKNSKLENADDNPLTTVDEFLQKHVFMTEEEAAKERLRVRLNKEHSAMAKKYGLPSTPYYILDGKKVKAVGFGDWSIWFESVSKKKDGRHVRSDHFNIGRAKVHVSTVFLGIDHGFRYRERGVPLVFETMIFGLAKHEGYQERYYTWEEAEAGHERAMKLVKGKI